MVGSSRASSGLRAREEAPGLRILEPLAALSLVTDLAHGRAPEQALRASLLAVRVAGSMGEDANATRHALYVTLLRSLGCTATSHEYATALGGDDIEVRRQGDVIDPTVPREAMRFVRKVASAQPWSGKVGVAIAGVAKGKKVAVDAAAADCEVARQLAQSLGIGDGIADALYQGFERWDGQGHPVGLRGDAIHLSARIAAASSAMVLFQQLLGAEAAALTLRRWAGRALDPELVTAVLDISPAIADAGDPLVALLNSEPSPRLEVPEARLDAVAEAFACVADLKAVHLQGHSHGVASLADRAAEICGLDATTRSAIRRAALLHDIGRAAVPTGVWERPGPLSSGEWEAVRLHAYHGERILSRSHALAPLARIAGSHHERLDGSGYHRGSTAADQDRPCRILAAADVYHALVEARPHRPAHGVDAAARILRTSSLDPEAVEAVLEAAGHVRRRPERPVGLTEREVEVLRLIVSGLSLRDVGKRLFIAETTAHTHVAHIYEKTGVSTRAAAAVFAMEHGLLEP